MARLFDDPTPAPAAAHAKVLADDPADRRTAANTHPPTWVNPSPAGRYNLVVVGGGTAGLVSAAGAGLLGAKVALVERGFTGGDCLVTGCVPSKAVIRAARAAADVRDAGRFGVQIPRPVVVDFAAAMTRMRQARAAISAHDAAARFRDEWGVDVYYGDARFVGPDAVEVDGARLEFRKAVIATGSRPAVPDVPGLAEVGCLTNETVFNLTDRPPRLAVVGGGPIGCELAQAFARLGSRVTVVQKAGQFLPREDREAADLLADVFAREGIDVHLAATVERVEAAAGGVKVLHVKGERGAVRVEAEAVLVATGRKPNVEGLGLEAAGVRVGPGGVVVDDFLRTSNRRVYAAGDVCLPWRFTHMADASARVAVQNALLPLPGPFRKRVSRLVVPWCTYTDPEVAHVGLYEREAREKGVETETVRVSLADVDRAVTDGETDGFLKVLLLRGSDRILGATLVARHAGEVISEITTAMVAGVGLKRLAEVIHPYPTQAEVIRMAADAYFRRSLGSRTRGLVRGWLRWRL